MGKSWKDRPGKSWDNFKRQKHRKQEKSWNTKNHISVRKEKSYSPFEDSQEYHESFA